MNIIQGGGTQINIIPDKCFIEIDRRVIPGENNQSILREVDNFLDKLKEENPLLELEREDPFVASPSMQINRDEEIVQALFRCIKDTRATEPEIRGGRFGTDAAIFCC